MPSYSNFSSAELQGAGSLVSTKLSKFSAKVPYVFHLPSSYSGSTYFTLETVRTANQIYDSSSVRNFSTPTIFPIYETVDMVKSDYVASFVLANGDNRFVLYPSADINGNTVYLRGTGNIALVVEQTALEAKRWGEITDKWDEDPNLWGI